MEIKISQMLPNQKVQNRILPDQQDQISEGFGLLLQRLSSRWLCVGVNLISVQHSRYECQVGATVQIAGFRSTSQNRHRFYLCEPSSAKTCLIVLPTHLFQHS